MYCSTATIYYSDEHKPKTDKTHSPISKTTQHLPKFIYTLTNRTYIYRHKLLTFLKFTQCPPTL